VIRWGLVDGGGGRICGWSIPLQTTAVYCGLKVSVAETFPPALQGHRPPLTGVFGC